MGLRMCSSRNVDWKLVALQNKRFTAENLLTHSFLRKPSNESVEQVAKVSALSQSEHCHHRLPSFIPIGDWSSEEAQKMEEQCGLPDDDFTFPVALMSRAARSVVADTWCTKQTTFALMGAA
ncbi:hypothetical protein M0R45_001002 [Rubus argutus]|uniref:Uncharacterized protein n=1 Tax=Rubus argutus TaxID=59490 RepID=A0AAW1VJA2_RUBAR